MGKFEGISSNTGDTGRDVNKIGQSGTIFEGIIPNTGDRFSLDSIRNGEISFDVGADASDRDRVFINTVG